MHADEAIELTWDPELADYVEAYRARNRARKVWRKIAILAGICFLFGIAGAVAQDGAVIGLGVGGLAAIGLIVFVFQPRAVRSLWRGNPAARARSQARVDPLAGLTTSNSMTTGQIQWSGVDSVLETDRLFLVQLAGYRRAPFVVLAKRGLADPAQVERLRALLTAGAGSAQSPRS